MALAPSKEQEVSNDCFKRFRDDLLSFTRWTYPDYEVSAHHIEIIKALEAVDRGEISNLIITCPPQKGKTESLVRFIAWTLARSPNKRIVYGTYGADRAEMVSGEIRDAVQTAEFKALFPDLALASDSKSKAHWKFAGSTGYVHAVGIGGPSTGFTSDLSVLDDFYKDAEEAYSEVIREKVWTWMKAVIATRKRTANVPTIILCTRWHSDDVIGRLLKEQPGKWTVLHFKALSDEGDALWPERWSVKDYEAVKADVGPHVWSALYQGEPVPAEGSLFKRDWLKVVDQTPRLERWIRYWDLAASVKDHADYTVGARVGVDDNGCIWVADIVRFREEWPDARRRILDTVRTDPAGTLVGVEKVGFQLAAIQDLRRNDEFLRVPLFELTPDKDKYSRAMAWAARAADGRLAICAGPWNREFMDEALVFPYGKHDDQIDAISGAVKLLVQMRGGYVQDEKAIPNNTWDYFRKLSGRDTPEDSDFDD